MEIIPWTTVIFRWLSKYIKVEIPNSMLNETGDGVFYKCFNSGIIYENSYGQNYVMQIQNGKILWIGYVNAKTKVKETDHLVSCEQLDYLIENQGDWIFYPNNNWCVLDSNSKSDVLSMLPSFAFRSNTQVTPSIAIS